MSASVRRIRRLLTLGVATSAIAAMAVPGAGLAAGAGGGPKPGIDGATVSLGDNYGFDGLDQSYDVAMDKSGTAYVGWLAIDSGSGGNRRLHLCVLPPKATSCLHGVQTQSLSGSSTAEGLSVLASASGATLIWFHDTDASESSPRGGEIAEAAATAGGTLSTPVDVADAPSHGLLLDAQRGPNGQIWTVAYAGLPAKTVEVRPGVSNSPVTAKFPWELGEARLGFDKKRPVIVATKAGSITTPGQSTYYSGGTWSASVPVKKTWAGQGFDLASSKHGLRLITTINNSDYFGVVAKWAGKKFGLRTREDNTPASCFPSSHDAVTDSTGRVVDVAESCGDGKISVTNLADSVHGQTLRIGHKGTFAGGFPHIVSSPRGHAWIVYTYENTGDTADTMLAVPFLLQGVSHGSKKKANHGVVTVHGPTSCQPASAISVSVSGKPDKGWKVANRSLKLGKHGQGSVLNGAALTPGKKYKLKGTVTFTSRGKKSKGKATLKFKACPKP